MTEAYLGTIGDVLLKISEALLKLMNFLLSSSQVRKVIRACFSQLREKCSASQRDGANLNSDALGAEAFSFDVAVFWELPRSI